MADTRRLVALSMVPELAKEVASQIDAIGSEVGEAVEVAIEASESASSSAGAASESAENAAQSASEASTSSAAAEAFVGPTFANTAAGLAATTNGQSFAVDNGDGTVTIWTNNAGSAVNPRSMLTTGYAASVAGAAAIGTAGGGTVQAFINSIPALTAGKSYGFQYGEMRDGAGANLMLRGATNALRLHLEPRVNIDSGISSKQDWMYDPYHLDLTQYRIFGIYNSTGDLNSTGESGITFLGCKNVGNSWGLWSSMHLGFQDDSPTGVPMKLYLFDHTAPQWYAPAKGGWRQGKSAIAGDYMTSLNAGVGRIYQAATTGICGDIQPVHTSGTVSDGGVDWTFVRQVASGSVRPAVVFGNRDDMPILGHTDVRVQFHAPTLTKYGSQTRWQAQDGTTGAWLQTAQTGGTEDWFYLWTRSGAYIRYHIDDRYWQPIGMARCAATVTATVGDTTPSVAGVETLVLNNSAPTVITALDDGIGGQRVRLVSNNSNTTLDISASATSNGLLRSASGNDIVMNQGGAIDLERHPTSNFWRVVGYP